MLISISNQNSNKTWVQIGNILW